MSGTAFADFSVSIIQSSWVNTRWTRKAENGTGEFNYHVIGHTHITLKVLQPASPTCNNWAFLVNPLSLKGSHFPKKKKKKSKGGKGGVEREKAGAYHFPVLFASLWLLLQIIRLSVLYWELILPVGKYLNCSMSPPWPSCCSLLKWDRKSTAFHGPRAL